MKFGSITFEGEHAVVSVNRLSAVELQQHMGQLEDEGLGIRRPISCQGEMVIRQNDNL
jgi:hypothetical protein